MVDQHGNETTIKENRWFFNDSLLHNFLSNSPDAIFSNTNPSRKYVVNDGSNINFLIPNEITGRRFQLVDSNSTRVLDDDGNSKYATFDDFPSDAIDDLPDTDLNIKSITLTIIDNGAGDNRGTPGPPTIFRTYGNSDPTAQRDPLRNIIE